MCGIIVYLSLVGALQSVWSLNTDTNCVLVNDYVDKLLADASAEMKAAKHVRAAIGGFSHSVSLSYDGYNFPMKTTIDVSDGALFDISSFSRSGDALNCTVRDRTYLKFSVAYTPLSLGYSKMHVDSMLTTFDGSLTFSVRPTLLVHLVKSLSMCGLSSAALSAADEMNYDVSGGLLHYVPARLLRDNLIHSDSTPMLKLVVNRLIKSLGSTVSKQLCN